MGWTLVSRNVSRCFITFWGTHFYSHYLYGIFPLETTYTISTDPENASSTLVYTTSSAEVELYVATYLADIYIAILECNNGGSALLKQVKKLGNVVICIIHHRIPPCFSTFCLGHPFPCILTNTCVRYRRC